MKLIGYTYVGALTLGPLPSLRYAVIMQRGKTVAGAHGKGHGNIDTDAVESRSKD